VVAEAKPNKWKESEQHKTLYD